MTDRCYGCECSEDEKELRESNKGYHYCDDCWDDYKDDDEFLEYEQPDMTKEKGLFDDETTKK